MKLYLVEMSYTDIEGNDFLGVYESEEIAVVARDIQQAKYGAGCFAHIREVNLNEMPKNINLTGGVAMKNLKTVKCDSSNRTYLTDVYLNPHSVQSIGEVNYREFSRGGADAFRSINVKTQLKTFSGETLYFIESPEQVAQKLST